jgi:hypothetical protein
MLESIAGIDDSQPTMRILTNKIMSNITPSKVISLKQTLNAPLDKDCADGRTSLARKASLSKNIFRY